MTSESSVAGHTPGPWEIRHRLNSAGLPNRGGRYVILQKGSSLREDFFICEMPFAACRGQDEIEHEANARLIAAAPTMLAALNEAYETLTCPDACNIDPILGSDNPHEHAAGMVHAAIARATGGA